MQTETVCSPLVEYISQYTEIYCQYIATQSTAKWQFITDFGKVEHESPHINHILQHIPLLKKQTHYSQVIHAVESFVMTGRCMWRGTQETGVCHWGWCIQYAICRKLPHCCKSHLFVQVGWLTVWGQKLEWGVCWDCTWANLIGQFSAQGWQV